MIALDWWNGNRSTLGRSDLSGLLIGATLNTRAEEIFHALIEATAFGTRAIVESFTDQGLPVSSIVAGGGLTRNALLMQIYADVTGRPISVAGAAQASALGAAMLGAVAAGTTRGGYATLREAAAGMAPAPSTVYEPDSDRRRQYDTLYREYKRLYRLFRTRRQRRDAVAERSAAPRLKFPARDDRVSADLSLLPSSGARSAGTRCTRCARVLAGNASRTASRNGYKPHHDSQRLEPASVRHTQKSNRACT